MTIGIIIALVNIVIMGTVLGLRISHWRKTRPTQRIGRLGVRYNEGATPVPGLQCIVDGLMSKISQKYGVEFATQFLSTIIIEVVPANGKRACPNAVVSQATRIAGSDDTERFLPLPGFKRFNVAVVLQTPDFNTASKMAIAHEIVKHILPTYRNEGDNNDHSRQDLNEMTDSIIDACQ